MADEYDSVPFPCCACDGTVIFTDQGEHPTFFHTMPYCERFNATNTTEDAGLNAATEWLLTEIRGPASIAKLRALAKKELWRPRDAIHAEWSRIFLSETDCYEKR